MKKPTGWHGRCRLLLLPFLRTAVLPVFSTLRQPIATTTKTPANGLGRKLEASKRNNGTLLDTGVDVDWRCGGGLSNELLSVVPVYVNVTFGGTDFVLEDGDED